VARARRRSASGQRADWVYRPQRWLQSDYSSGEANPSGTYDCAISMSSGSANATAQVLYDSDNTVRSYGVIDPATATWMDLDAAARPQGADSGALIHGVDVDFHFRPSTWALGSSIRLGWRVVVADQDADTGQAQLDVSYSMWDNILGVATGEPARFANGRQNCGEGRYVRSFDSNAQIFDVKRYIRCKRRLQAQEGLFLYIETTSDSVNLSYINLFCRTLVTDST